MAEVPDLGDHYGALITQFPSEVSKTERLWRPVAGGPPAHNVCWGRREADDCTPRNKKCKNENGRSADLGIIWSSNANSQVRFLKTRATSGAPWRVGGPPAPPHRSGGGGTG